MLHPVFWVLGMSAAVSVPATTMAIKALLRAAGAQKCMDDREPWTDEADVEAENSTKAAFPPNVIDPRSLL